MQTHLNLSNAVRLIGSAALVLGILTAGYLYQSFGANIPEKLIYTGAGILFAASCGVLLPAAVRLWNAQNPAGAGAVFLFWLAAILPLGLAGHGGFFSVAQADLAASGLAAEAARAKLSALELQAGQYQSAGAVDLAALQSSLAALQAQENTAQAALAACPSKHFQNCINPKTAALGVIQAQIQTAEAQIAAATRLADVSSQRAMAATELALVSAGGSSVAGSVHPLFTLIGELFGVVPTQARAVFLAWSAIALELLAATMFLIGGAVAGSSTGNGYQLPAAGVERPETVPALDTGATITADGLAFVHEGEKVLNVAAVEALENLHPGLLDKANSGGLSAVNTSVVSNRVEVRYQGYERVAPALSRVPGKNRVNKIDSCAVCGADFLVSAYNSVRCKPCSDKVKQSHQARVSHKRG